MTTWLHAQRIAAVEAVVRDCGARTVLDLGCGDGDLLTMLAGNPRIERNVGIDLDREALARLRARLDAHGAAPRDGVLKRRNVRSRIPL